MTADPLADDITQAAACLSGDGLLAGQVQGFAARPQQQQMAAAVEQALADDSTLIVEAGTGTGKTFAYLVPVVLSGQKVLISTGTRHLQDQLFHRDIPTVTRALAASVSCTMLKGRSNYLCIDRLQRARQGSGRNTETVLEDFDQVFKWSARTKTGDIAELTTVEENSQIWPLVTSTVDNCLGSKCTHFDDCHLNIARKRAQECDVVVINHHLYFADAALREDGFGKLLPETDAIIFDEAHQIPDIASNFLGSSLGGQQLLELATDTRLAEIGEKSLVGGLVAAADSLQTSTAEFRSGMGNREQRVAWSDILNETPGLERNLARVRDDLNNLGEKLELAAPAGELLGRCLERCQLLILRCERILEIDDSNRIRWLDITRRSFRLNETPLHIGSVLGTMMADNKQARVFTSATLSVDGDFSHFLEQVGLGEVDTRTWESPFDFNNQGILYLPEAMPDPRDSAYSEALIRQALPLLRATSGRAFFLFTSYRVMSEVFDGLENTGEFELLRQGTKTKQELLEQFSKGRNVILLGTMSFWEGVDVRGEALSLVIIDKLPFESPADPVLRARLRSIEENGGNPFMDYQLPRAVITLRQGAGRLIRDTDDVGVLMICDPRVRRSRYGRQFLKSIPPMLQTSDFNLVKSFIEDWDEPGKGYG
jgi:ATP-dependent DNA helicase DinG